MARDFWLTRRLAPAVEKIRQTITLEATTQECFRQRASVAADGAVDCDLISNTSGSISLTDNFTLEFWCKVLHKPGQSQIILAQFIAPADGIDFNLDDDGFLEVVGAGGVAPSFQGFPFGEWVHLAFTLDDATTGRQRLYVNGVLVDEQTSVAVLGTGINSYRLNHDSATFSFIGNVSECRIWNVAREPGEILAAYDKPQGLDTVLLNLVGYNRIDEGTGATSLPTNGDLTLTLDVNNSWSTDDYPPLIYGASFVVAEWPISLDNAISLVWPQDPDEGTTGMLVVRWIDDDGEVQRRRLWDLDGVDIAPFPELYGGENVTADFTLELWNIDGESTCVLPEDLILSISYTTQPQTSYDREQQSAATATIDTTLAEPFPFVFPLTFNSQQTY